MNKRLSKIGIALVVLLTLLSFIPLRNLKFHFSFEDFFPASDPDVVFFQQFKSWFHTEIDDEYIFIGLKNNGGIFQQDFLQKADSLSRFISSSDHILRVYSVTHTGYVYLEKGNLKEGPVIHISQPELYRQDSIELFASREYRSLLVSNDGSAIAITAFNSPNLNDREKDRLLESIQKKIDRLGFDEAHVAAKIKIERTYVKEIARNLKFYISIAFLLIAIVLFFLYWSLRGIEIPFLTITITVCWTLALISLMNYPVDILSSLIPPVLAVICLSNVIHLSAKYAEELKTGASKPEALKKTFRGIGQATFFASLTTTAGFFTLCITDIIPIRLFGIFAGTGVLIAFVVATLFVLSAYANSPEPKMIHSKKADRRWERFLSALLGMLIGRRYWFLSFCLVAILLCSFFIGQIQTNSSMLQEIPGHNPILQDYRFIEEKFAGTRPFELALMPKDSGLTLLKLDVLRQVEQVESFLKDSCGVGFLISPVTFIKGGNKAFRGGAHEDYKLPDRQQEVYRILDRMMFTDWGNDLIRFLTLDGKHLRISGKLPDLTTRQFQALNERFDNFYRRHESSLAFTYKMTGSAVLLDKVSDSLTRNMLFGLLLAFLTISLIVAVAFRSFKMVLMVLITNIIPLIMMAAAMGILGIYLKADTSIIFAIAFGIAVDDSLHFINRFRQERAKGKSIAYAVKRTYLSTGKAMVITTLVLLAGFVALLFSSFSGTFYIGLLVSICLSIALLAALSVLPLLILFFYEDEQ